jgi:tRNA (mo5U34)-methyltransferase
VPGTDPALRRRIAEVELWYHVIELAPGVETPGWFDLRPVLDRMPWPDVRGLRCLDIGTYDGFLAFEMERRGAAEVVAVDIGHHEDWDWVPRVRNLGPVHLAAIAGEKGAGFAVAHDALGSTVQREVVSVYDLAPERLGTFDVVVCGSLLLHLRDPLRALEAIRSVCAGAFLSAETIDLVLTVLQRRRPSFWGNGSDGQWLLPNRAGHAWALDISGFDVEATSRPYSVPLGPGHPGGRRWGRDQLLQLALTGGRGVPHVAVRGRPAV